MTSAAAWMNGQFIDYNTMAVPVWDLGVVAGASITEMARTFGHRPFRLHQHLDRLIESCEELSFNLPFSHSDLLSAATEVVNRNVVGLTKAADLGVVIFATAGANRTYLGDQPLPPPTVGIHSFKLPFGLWQNSAINGIKLVTTPVRQHDQQDLPIHLKVRNRLHWWLADQQADQIQSGAKALLLDAENRITETSTSAFYVVIDDTIVTPNVNVLKSMSRKMVEEAAGVAGIKFETRELQLQDLSDATECFVSSTPVGILPVASVNSWNFPVGSHTSAIPRLLNYWLQQTGINPQLQLSAADRNIAE